MSTTRNRAAEQHALEIRKLLALFWGRALDAPAIEALANLSAQLHVAVFGGEPARPLPRGGAEILPFVRKKGLER